MKNIEQRFQRRHEKSTRQSAGRYFELIADLTDEDGAWTEMQNLPWWLLANDDDQDDTD